VSVDDYIALIDSVLERLSIFKDKYYKSGNENIDLIVEQLNFILDVAKSGRSFKHAIIDYKKERHRNFMKRYPINDGVLSNALREIYDDLESHDYNVGNRLSQEMSLHFLETIIAKSSEYEKYFREENLSDERYRNNYVIAYLTSDNLMCNNYYSLWIKHGIKNLQYFFLPSSFTFTADANNEIELIEGDFAAHLHKDIFRIRDFYETDEAEGTHMYLNPVKIEEIDGLPHLVDLKGNIVAYPQK